MSGHSKWANIKHKKAAQDAKKGKVFTKIARELAVAAREAGGDASSNPRLRLALEKAKSVNMPKENLERAVKKGTGEGADTHYESAIYEGYGPGGVAILVTALTDNKNRTVADVRKVLNKRGGSMGEAGCVSWIFEKKGVVYVRRDVIDEDALLTVALDFGADDVSTEGDSYEIIIDIEDYEGLKNVFIENNIEIKTSDISMEPKNSIEIDKSSAKKLFDMINELEDLDDVQEVYTNVDVNESMMEDINV